LKKILIPPYLALFVVVAAITGIATLNYRHMDKENLAQSQVPKNENMPPVVVPALQENETTHSLKAKEPLQIHVPHDDLLDAYLPNDIFLDLMRLDDYRSIVANQKSIISEIETDTASCMAQNGFTYIPLEDSQNSSTDVGSEGSPTIDETEIRNNGYGISTIFISELTPENHIDNNFQEQYEKLPESEKNEYWNTFYGDTRKLVNAIASMTEVEKQDFFTKISKAPGDLESLIEPGCFVKAQDKHILSKQHKNKLSEYLSTHHLPEIYNSISSDSRISEAQKNWSACMNKLEYNFDSQQDAMVDIENKFTILAREVEDQSHDDSPMELTGEHMERYKVLRSLELSIAISDLECGGQELKILQNRVIKEKIEGYTSAHTEELQKAINSLLP